MSKKSSGGTQTSIAEPASYIKPFLGQAANSAAWLYSGQQPVLQTPMTSGSTSGAKDKRGGVSGMLGNVANSIADGTRVTAQPVDPFQAVTQQYYPDSTVAPMSNTTQAGLQGQAERAMAGSPLVDAAQQFVRSGLQSPVSTQFGASQNPYASMIDVGGGFNPYSRAVRTNQQANPYSQAVTAGTEAQNPYASANNPFGGASNPYLDNMVQRATQSAMNGVESQFARGGRNVRAALPVASDISSNIAAQIYGPAYESERNRQLQYQSQLTGIGANAFESQQGRQLQSALTGQGIGAQGYENARSQGLQAALAGQGIGAGSFDAAQARQAQAAMQGQQIGAQGYENAQNRALSDLTSQRGLQQGLLGYASPLAAQDYMDLAQLRDVGSQYDQYNQNVLNDSVNRWNFNQEAPGQALDQYIARLTGMPGGTTSTQLPTQNRNLISSGIGGALGGAGLANLLGMSTPWGAALGALGGLL